MKIVTDRAQDEYWERVGYRDSGDAVIQAFARPKIEYVSQLVDLSNSTVLDVGCGNGAFTAVLLEKSRHVVGLDYSEHMLVRNPGKRLLRGRAQELPFRDECFDVVFVANLLHHSQDPRQIVREIIRVSRRHLILLEPNRLNPVMFLFSLLVREERGGLRSCKSYLNGLLRDGGCRVIRCSAMGMISENNTPRFLVRLLKMFDREIFWGEYLVAVAEKV